MKYRTETQNIYTFIMAAPDDEALTLQPEMLRELKIWLYKDAASIEQRLLAENARLRDKVDNLADRLSDYEGVKPLRSEVYGDD